MRLLPLIQGARISVARAWQWRRPWRRCGDPVIIWSSLVPDMFVVCMDHGGRPAGLKILLICLVKNVARNGDSNGLKKGTMILREIRYGLMILKEDC